MFEIVSLQDQIELPPSSFGRDQIEALTEEIDKKYANRVIHNIGLCICLYSFEKIGDAYIYPSEGSAHHIVTFKMVIFRPTINEVLIGTVMQSNEKMGIKISMDFFQDIIIPPHLLPEKSIFDRESRQWVWTYHDEDDPEAEPSVLKIENREKVRFRVTGLAFTKFVKTPNGTQQAKTTSIGNAMTSLEKEKKNNTGAIGMGMGNNTSSSMMKNGKMKNDPFEEIMPYMKVVGSMKESGLGMVDWWGEGDLEEEEEEVETLENKNAMEVDEVQEQDDFAFTST